MCTHNQYFRAKKKNIIIHLKINIFTDVKYCCILNGCVCGMLLALQEQNRDHPIVSLPYSTGAGCLKIMTSLVNVSLNFKT